MELRRFDRAAAVLAVGVLAIAMAAVPVGASGAAPATQAPSATAASTSSSTFQVTVGSQSFTATLPTSSVATYVLPEGSSTLNPTETATKDTKLNPKIELASQPPISASPSDPALPQITVDPSTTSQTISGFGGAMTDSSAYLINNSPQRAAILADLYGTAGADFNLTRVPFGASDMTQGSTLLGHHVGFESYDDTAGDTSLSHFSIAHDETDVIPVLQSAKAINPGAEIIALPWSAPGWMKISGKYLSGCTGSANYLKPADYKDYAAYLTRAVQMYEATPNDLPISILSMQNEPHNCNPTYPTMMMEPSDQAKLSLDLSTDLASAGLTTVPKIMGWDHNWNDYNDTPGTACADQSPSTFPQSLLSLPNAVSDIGYHSYCGLPYVPEFSSTKGPSKGNPGIYVTESTGDMNANNQASNLVYEVKNDLIDPIRDGAEGSLYWNLALDQDCGPQFNGGTTCNYCPKSGPQPAGTTCDKAESSKYGGCMDCRPMVTVDNQSGTYTLNEDYYYWAQFSKFVQPGAVRVASSTVGSLDTVAFQNPSPASGGNGEIVVVVVSGSTPTTLDLSGVKTVVGDGEGAGYCALLSTGGVDCWGYNGNGELGNGTIDGPDGEYGYDTPQAVTGITNDVSVTSDGAGYCALLSTGGVDCWGYNGYGQLGNGTIEGPDGEGGYDTPQAVSSQ